MSEAIKREDIRKGDRVRMIATTEFTAGCDFTESDLEDADDERYELIERPEPVPTESGWYFDKEGDPWQVCNEAPRLNPKWGPYTRIRSTAEVAAEVLADVRENLMMNRPTMTTLEVVAAKWATK